MPDLALVTGASSGIGQALARIHAERGGDLIIAARREDALTALKAELESAHGVTVHVMPCDLAESGGADGLADRIETEGLVPDILVNNAGFGGRGRHIERPLEREQAMIDVNVKALVTLCHRIGKAMAARGSGRILNLGSTAGMVPGPNQAIYFATKAFVNSFSQALDQELRPKGVTCTVLTPGYVETGFAEVADLGGTMLTRTGTVTAEGAAKAGYKAMMAGKRLAYDRASARLALDWLLPFAPRRAVLGLVERAQRK